MPFKYRVIVITSLFLFLGIKDYMKNPTNPKKAKEYCFLFSVAIVAMIYGIFHDFITYHISPEYFIYGKELESAKDGYSFDVIKMAMTALWSAGLVVAAVFLMLNNPRKTGSQLSYPTLWKLTLYPLAISILFAVPIGLTVFCKFVPLQNYFPSLTGSEVETRLLTTWGIHIGSYLGGAIGLIVSSIKIVKLRKSSAVTESGSEIS